MVQEIKRVALVLAVCGAAATPAADAAAKRDRRVASTIGTHLWQLQEWWRRTDTGKHYITAKEFDADSDVTWKDFDTDGDGIIRPIEAYRYGRFETAAQKKRLGGAG